MTGPFPFLVHDDKEGSEQGKLNVCCDGPTPEETAVVWRLEVGIDLADHEKLRPPVLVTILEH